MLYSFFDDIEITDEEGGNWKTASLMTRLGFNKVPQCTWSNINGQ